MICLHPQTRYSIMAHELQGRKHISQTSKLSPAFCRMALENDSIAGTTIELLEARLQRLTYLLTGDTSWTGTPTAPAKPASLDDTVSRRLLRLEKDLENLSRTIPAVRDVLQLRKHSFHVPCRRTKTDRIQMIASPTSSVLHLRNPSRRT